MSANPYASDAAGFWLHNFNTGKHGHRPRNLDHREHMGIKADIVSGRGHEYSGQAASHLVEYESARRRAARLMCLSCLRARHAECDSERCPCACNDSDFRFARNKLTAIGAIPVDLAKLAQHWGEGMDSATVCPTVAKS